MSPRIFHHEVFMSCARPKTMKMGPTREGEAPAEPSDRDSNHLAIPGSAGASPSHQAPDEGIFEGGHQGHKGRN